jgi:aerobic carbon-monoxide dehydrogenase medium subunit
MKPAPFDYFSPTSVDEALALLARHGYGAKLLAGGQSLIPAMNFRLAQPSVLIDLNKIPNLSYIRASNGSVVIGAMTRHSKIEHDPVVAERAPLLAQVGPNIAHPQIRNRGTFGGSMAHADPAAHWPVASLALGARFHLRKQGKERWVNGEDFFTGLYMTALEPAEMLLEIEVRAARPGWGCSYQQVARQHGAFPLAGVAVALSVDAAGRCQSVDMVYLGAGDRPMVAKKAAKVLIGQELTPESFRAAADAGARFDADPGNDIHASADYRKHLVRVLSEKALTEASSRARSKQ